MNVSSVTQRIESSSAVNSNHGTYYNENAATPAINAPNIVANEDDERADAPPLLAVVDAVLVCDAVFVPVEAPLVTVAIVLEPPDVPDGVTLAVPLVVVPVGAAPDEVVPEGDVVVPFPGAPCNWPLPFRYAGIAL